MTRTQQSTTAAAWPELPLQEWQATLDTLHMWLQVVGKIKLELVPFLNQWWNVTLLPTSRGLTTGLIPYEGRAFEIELDFLEHNLYIRDSAGGVKSLALIERTVADFYANVMAMLAALDIHVTINPMPAEVPHPIPFDVNDVNKEYDPEYAARWWRILLNTSMVLQTYNSRFTGKSSPVQFFWGSFDLGQTRFSGRPADPPQGVPRFVQLAENEENVACGFWPGNTTMSGITFGEPAYYSYIHPQPAGYSAVAVRPAAAYYDRQLGEFILRYEDVRTAPDPALALLDFFESTYAAGADLARWDRAALEANPR